MLKWSMMTRGLRKLALAAHVSFSVGWLGAVTAFLALSIAGVRSQHVQTVRAAYSAMGLLMSFVLVPFAFTSLFSGLTSALGTNWGLFRHYWVLVKLLLTIIAVAVLLAQLEPIRQLAVVAADPASSVVVLVESRRPLIHAAGGLVVLLVAQVLGMYKPRGMTRYGWRQRRHQTSESQL